MGAKQRPTSGARGAEATRRLLLLVLVVATTVISVVVYLVRSAQLEFFSGWVFVVLVLPFVGGALSGLLVGAAAIVGRALASRAFLLVRALASGLLAGVVALGVFSVLWSRIVVLHLPEDFLIEAAGVVAIVAVISVLALDYRPKTETPTPPWGTRA